MGSRSHIIRGAILAAILLTLGFLALDWSQKPYAEAQSIGARVSNFDELKERFTSLAEKRGAEYAFEVLRRADLPPNTDLHLLGHAVGEVLYTQKGVEGIADCTENFRNACSHAIVIGTLNEYGTGGTTQKMIDDACKKAPGGKGAYTMCYHGLGHGVFAYFGYSLEKTVSWCKKMGTPLFHDEQFTQCVGGATMELMGGGGHDRKLWLAARTQYLGADPLSPCMSRLLPDQAKYFCLTYITPRLFELAGADIGRPDPATFPAAFAFCDTIPKNKEAWRGACFGGFGKEFIVLAGERDIRAVDRFSDSQYRTAIGWCALASAEEGKAMCLSGALDSLFWGGENDPRASLRFCGLISSAPLKDTCYQHLAEIIAHYTPERKDVCARIPSYNARCEPAEEKST